MFTYQGTAPVYPHVNLPYPTVPHRTFPLDVNWFDTWPIIRTILLAVIMLFSSAAIIGLDIANLAIEGKKQFSGLGVDSSKVGAGIWSGSISFLAALFILTIRMYKNLFIRSRFNVLLFLVFVQNKRIAATFALIAVTLAFFFTY